ncbi:DUF2809 domain-containing protein [Clostridium sp. YIM B02505]|uniref:DUF2809 domain-containing protein n=1 Tax=Clostridium yunnanense TaxID=2800325 RepID=A0ABS1EMC3_9CLOT|nr:DUF2809 domain-containing protein [Clostridium yunnanense]MBK1810547.1 DUF2809 domain-containing protein [Clostridium yunnanense]
MKINRRYILSFIILFIIETLIALYVHDGIIRPYIGDILVVVLMYTFIRGIVKKRIRFLPVYLFLFASAVEIMQYFRFIDLLHLRSNRVASVILGTSFDIKDILCYLAGSIILIMWEQFVDREI